jgi:fatty acid desaturase
MTLKLAAHWYERKTSRGFACIAYGWTMWFGAGLLAMAVWSTSWPWLLCVPLSGLCLGVSGMGMFYVTTLAHEGFHGSLNRNRYVSMGLGVAASSAVPLFASVGYTIRHWHHHLYTNTLRDPDFADYRAYRTFTGRVAFATLNSATGFWKNLAYVFVAPRALDLRHYPFRVPVLRGFAAFNVVCVLGNLSAVLMTVVAHPRVGVFVYLIPGVIAQIYLGIVPYIDHAGVGHEKGANARTCSSRLLTVLLLGTNFHREHHLHPSVVSYKLPALHRHYLRLGAIPAHGVVTPHLLDALHIGATANLEP